MGVLSTLELELEFAIVEERVKPENPEKNLLKQKRQPTTNPTHI